MEMINQRLSSSYSLETNRTQTNEGNRNEDPDLCMQDLRMIMLNMNTIAKALELTVKNKGKSSIYSLEIWRGGKHALDKRNNFHLHG